MGDSTEKRPKKATDQLTPPEGGWGWMVSFGTVLVFISTAGQFGSFGLLFQGILSRLGEQMTGATLITNVLAASVNFTGLVTTHLLASTSYRIVALIGALLFSVGVLLTIFAQSMGHIIVTYSIIAGIGLGLVAPSSYVAFNSFFVERRGLALGISEAGVGLGLIAAPHLVHLLLELYGFRGSMLILAGFALHAAVGALLFHPVQWHQPRRRKSFHIRPSHIVQEEDLEEVPLHPAEGAQSKLNGTELSLDVIPEEEDDLTNERFPSNFEPQVSFQDTECDEHVVISRRGSLVMSAMPDSRTHLMLRPVEEEGDNSSMTAMLDKLNDANYELSQAAPRRPPSVSLANFGSNVLMFDSAIGAAQQSEPEEEEDEEAFPPTHAQQRRPIVRYPLNGDTAPNWLLLQTTPDEELNNAVFKSTTVPNDRSRRRRKWLDALSTALDLSLLRDVVYVNIVLGLSVSFVSDANFFTLLPFFLQSAELGFTGGQTALCLSVVAGADVVARLVLPWVAERLHVRPRDAYLLGCIASAIARSIVASLEGFVAIAIMSGVVGFLKGAMVVNLSLTIADHCSLERFPAAHSLYMVITSLTTVTLGPLSGVLRDSSGSFPFSIHVLSAVMMSCAVCWLLEYLYLWYRDNQYDLAHKVKRTFC